MNAAVDNDIILKGACYGIIEELLASVPDVNEVGVLGAARYVVSARIIRAKLQRSGDDAMKCLETFLAVAKTLEPTESEQRTAAEIETAAQEMGVALDSGESQLCAVVVTRDIHALLTGDKRAIVALEQLVEHCEMLAGICGKALCLEQLSVLALGQVGLGAIRTAVCSEPAVDRALTICFACSSQNATLDVVLSGLTSYINHLRAEAGRILSS